MRYQKMIIGLCFFLFSIHGSTLLAEESEFKIKQGLYVGISVVHNNIGGDFDDTIYIVHEDADIYGSVPEIDSAVGGRGVIGYRTGKLSMELAYQRVDHDSSSTIPGIGGDAHYNVVDLNFKYDVFARSRFRPYGLLGIGGTWLDLENARTNGDLTSYSDETFYGFSLNVGAGLSFYITPRWFLDATAMYRWQQFKGLDDRHLTHDLNASGMNYSFGLAYTF